MDHHRTTVVGAQDAWQAKCSCKWRSPVTPRSEAVDAELKHQHAVRRAQAGLRKEGAPSLGSLRAFYQSQADNPVNEPADRELWQRLADELVPFIPPSVDEDQLKLWE